VYVGEQEEEEVTRIVLPPGMSVVVFYAETGI
jgi:hypothetical protein